MAARITVVGGPARSGKTERLLDGYAQCLADGPPGGALWLSPTHRAALAIGPRLRSHGISGCLRPNILSFDQLSRAVLAASPLAIRPLGPLAQQHLLKHLIDESLAAGRLSFFKPIAHTRGFLDLLVRFLQELKRLEVWPEEFAKACGPRPGGKDRELCYLYHQYQQLLTEHDLYDAQGRFWSAREQLRHGQLKPLEHVRHVFVDGFTDFTRTEHEILEILAERALSMAISLPMDADAARNDLFAKTTKTLSELRRRHGQLAVESLPRRASAVGAFDHLEQHLFANPRAARPAADPRGIEIVAAPSARAEIEWVAARIKSLLVQGAPRCGGETVRPGDILVVFRSPAEMAELVRSVFAEFGIPAAIAGHRMLGRAPALQALAAWLRLDAEDWPFGSLLSVLGHNCFRPAWPEWHDGRAALAAEWLVRRLQIASGREALLEHVERLAGGSAAKLAGSKATRSTITEHARLALPLLARMGNLFDDLPRRAPLASWIEALGKLGESIGLNRAAESTADPVADDGAEAGAWTHLLSALTSVERCGRWLGRARVELSRLEFLDELEMILRSEPLPAVEDEVGHVRVLGAEQVRNLSAPYVFLAGLSEKAFPPPQTENCLLNEAETRRLAAAGLPVVAQTERDGFEMLLFYEVATRATRRLTLSYPALDAAAQPLAPSPYLTEVERALEPAVIERHEQVDLDTVPKTDDVFSPRDFRVRAVAQAVRGDAGLVSPLHHHAATYGCAPNVVAALRASSERGRGTSFGAYEGMLLSPAAGRVLAERFGPAHCWSASRLEQYANCPFQFFMERVLSVEPVDDPVLAPDYLQRGRMLHEVLAELHRELNRLAAGPSSPGGHGDDAFNEQVAAQVAELVEQMASNRPLDDGLLEIEARRLTVWLARYRVQHAKYDAACGDWEAPPRPAHFEVAFGPRHGGDPADAQAALEFEDPLSSLEPLELECHSETVLFAGRIDRIDIGSLDGQTVFNIIDYKSGKSSRAKAKSVREGYALQLPVYALAAERLLAERQAVPLHAAYWHVASSGWMRSLEFATAADGRLRPSDEWAALSEQLRMRIGKLVAAIRQGQFPVISSDEDCTSRCAYSTVCRVNQVRSLDKTWQPGEEAK